MDAILPGHIRDVHQAKVSLIDQCRGLQGIARPLRPHLSPSQTAQLPVDQGDKLLQAPPGRQPPSL